MANAHRKVLIACSHFWPSVGGLEVIAGQLGAELVQTGYEVDVATWAMPERTSSAWRGMRILSLNTTQIVKDIPLWILELRALITSGEYDACILLADPQNQIIWSVEGADIPKHTRLLIQPLINREGYGKWQDNQEFRSRLAALLRQATATLALTRNGAEVEFMREEGVPFVFVPNAVERAEATFDFRRRYSLGQEEFLILHVANLWEVKNHIGLMQALADMPEHWRLVMVGNPAADTDYYRRVLKELQKHPRMMFIPGLPPEGIAAAMQAAHVIVLASMGEVSPVTILEAMSHATPWLATPECGAVHEHAGGFIAPLKQFIPFLQTLEHTPALRQEAGKLGYEHWQASYSWSSALQGWKELIDTGELSVSFAMPRQIEQSMRQIQMRFMENMATDNMNNELPPPLVSVIIPTYNRVHQLKNALRSLAQQTFRDFEVVIVNDAGADIEPMLEEFRRVMDIQSIRHEQNRERSAARNTALSAARGKYIAYLDDDDLYYPNHLELLAHYLETTRTAVAYTDAVRAQFQTEHGKEMVVRRDIPYSFDFSRDRFLYENYVPILCLMHRKDCLQQAGIFDEELARPLEDWDLWIRLSQRYDFAHLPVQTCEFRECVDPQHLARLDRRSFYTKAEQIFRKYHALTAQRPDIQRLQQGYLTGLRQIEQQYQEAARQSLVSIIIPTLNNLNYTRQCIEGIQAESQQGSYEIIIVDNGSTDGTIDYLRAMQSAGELRAIFNERNETFSHANNQGAALARGAYFLFLNNDTLPLEGWIDGLVADFERDASIGIQGGKLLYPGNIIQHAGIVYGPVKSGMNMHYHIYLCMNPGEACVNKAREFQMVTGAMLAIRREIYQQLGGFDERYVFGHEDLDLCLAVRKLGYKVWYNPRFAAYHFESMTKKSEGIEKFELRLQDPDSIDAKNYHYFHRKWGSFLQADADKYYREDGFIPAFAGNQEEGRASQNDRTKSQSNEQGVQAEQSGTERKLRILFTMYGWNESGGGTTFPKSVAIRLAKLGYEVAVFYAAGQHPSVVSSYHLDEATSEGVHLFGISNRPTIFLDAEHPAREIYDGNVVRLFGQILDSFKPDIVHYHNFLGLSFSIADEVKRRNIPSLYTPHNYHLIDPMLYLFDRSDLSLWKGVDFFANSELAARHPEKRQVYLQRISAAQRLLNNSIDHTLAVSGRQRDLLMEFGGEPSKMSIVHQVHESIDMLLRKEPHAPVEHPVLRFGFLGGAMPHKGVHVIAQAAQRLRSGSVEFHIYGFVSDVYKEQVQALDPHNMLHWKGAYRTEDLPMIARALDGVIVPSVWEDCAPLVVAEALAMKLPVIGARIGGIPDFIEDRVNGRLYTYNKPDELAQIVQEYILQPGSLHLMQRNCTIPYTFDDYVRHVAGLYEQLSSGRGLRPTDIALLFKQHKTSSQATETAMDSPMNRIQFSQSLPGGFSNRPAQAGLPQPLPSPLYLNLGCGRDVREDCVNLDLYSDDPRVVAMDIRKLDIPDSVADAILASDVLEHFSHREVDAVLKEWARVLKPGGELVIRCPSLRLQMKAYMNGVWDADTASYMIFGGQTNPGDYHCIGFDEQSISRHLRQAGLDVSSFEEVDTPQDRGFINLNMTVRARKAGAMRTTPVADRPGSVIYQQMENTHKGSPPSTINLVWEGSQFVTHSLALINRELCSNIIKSGVADVTIVPYEPDDFSPKGNPKYEELQAHDVRFKPEAGQKNTSPFVWVRHQWPPKFDPPKGAKWIVMQPWEFSTLRKDFIEAFKGADEVWTPSNYSRDAFVRSGLDFNKVQIIPNGIDPQLFTPFGAIPQLPTTKKFKFLFVGGTIFRKGIDILLEAYAEAFTAADNVCLIVKDMGGTSFYKGQTAKQTIDAFRKNPDAPEIWYTDARLPEEQIAELYRACDAFVCPYRGEGFSLPTLEAMASGLPVIVTEGGATDDFVDEEVGWLITAGERSLGSVIDGHPLTGEAVVLEPHKSVLVEAMKYAYDRPAEAAAKGIAGSLRARTQWTWNRSTIKALSRLDALCGTEMAAEAEKKLQDREDGLIAFAKAEAAYRIGRLDEAIELYNTAITLRGLSEEYTLLTLHRLASLSLHDGEVDLAEDFLNKARDVQFSHPDTDYIQSLCHAWRSGWDAALDLLEPLLDNWKTLRFVSRLGVTLDTLLCDMGRALYSLGIIEDAKEVYTLALSVNAENAEACYGSALCLLEFGAQDEARTMLEWALRLRPDFEAAQEMLEELGS